MQYEIIYKQRIIYLLEKIYSVRRHVQQLM